MTGSGIPIGDYQREISEKYYLVNGIQLHVIECGPKEGPLLILLHGFPEFWYGWRKQIPFFAARGYRVVVPDQRGYNLSSKPSGIRAYHIEKLTQDIVGLITALGVDKVYLVGHDWGAAVAWSFSKAYPQYLHRLVIINVPHPAVIRHTLLTRIDQVCRSWYILFFQLPKLPEWVIRANGFFLMRKTLERTSLPGTFSTEDLHQYVKAWRQPGTFKAMINWYRAAARSGSILNTWKQAPDSTIEIPVLILWGAKDTFLRAEMAEKSLQQCTNGQLMLFKDATHWVHHEKSEAVNEAILAFIRS